MANDRLAKTYVKVIVIVALVVICALCVWQKEIPKGLDLAGGTELIYRVRVEDLSPEQQKTAVQDTMDIIRKRLDPDGSKELSIRKQGTDRFYIQLPNLGAADSRRVEDLVRRAGKHQTIATIVTRWLRTHI